MEAGDKMFKYNGVQPLVNSALASRHTEIVDAFDKEWKATRGWVGHSWLCSLPRPSGKTVNTSFLFPGVQS